MGNLSWKNYYLNRRNCRRASRFVWFNNFWGYGRPVWTAGAFGSLTNRQALPTTHKKKKNKTTTKPTIIYNFFFFLSVHSFVIVIDKMLKIIKFKPIKNFTSQTLCSLSLSLWISFFLSVSLYLSISVSYQTFFFLFGLTNP